MAVSVTGTATLTVDVSPIHDHVTLTAIFALAPEQLTIKQLDYLRDATKRVKGGEEPATVVGTLFS